MTFLFEILPPILNFIGAIVVGLGMLISNKQALDIGVAKYASDKEEENMQLPAVKDKLKQRKLTIIGLVILFVGLILELASVWI